MLHSLVYVVDKIVCCCLVFSNISPVLYFVVEVMQMNLKKAIDLFLLTHANLESRRTYRSCLTQMSAWISLERPIEKVGVPEMIEYISTLHDRNYAQATILKHIVLIKAFFSFLVTNDIIEKSPVKNVKRPRLKPNIERSKAMTDAQLKQLLDYSKWLPRHDALIRFLADTGCRIGGVATLKVIDVDFENCRAKVTEKGNKLRMVGFGDSTRKALRRWLLERDKKTGLMFSERDTITVSALSQLFRLACKKSGIGSYGPHTLRHRMGYQLSDAKVPLPVAATVMGHESTDTTLHYYPKDWDRAEQVFKSLALPDTSPSLTVLKMPKSG